MPFSWVHIHLDRADIQLGTHLLDRAGFQLGLHPLDKADIQMGTYLLDRANSSCEAVYDDMQRLQLHAGSWS